MSMYIFLALVVGGVIHLLPAIGVLGPARLGALYGTSAPGPDVEILLRHRAVLFGLLGALMVTAAFVPSLQIVAFTVGLLSTLSFVAVARIVGGYNAHLARVVRVDIVALVALTSGAIALALSQAAR